MHPCTSKPDTHARALMLAIFAAAGCGDAEGGRTAQTVDSAGVRIVTSLGVDADLSWVADTVRVLGEGGGAPELGAIAPHFVGAGGDRVYVLDEAGHRVVAFDAGGDTTSWGRAGKGPGELSGPIGLSVRRADGTVWVHDYGRGAIVGFDADGKAIDPLPMTGDFWGPKLEVASAGVVYNGLGSEGGKHETLVLRAGAEPATLLAQRPGEWAQREVPGCPFRMELPPLFHAEVVWDAEGDRIAAAAAPVYAIEMFEGAALVGSVRRSIEPTHVDEARAVAEAEALLARVFSPNMPCRPTAAQVARALGHADVAPVVRAVVLAPAGELWVLRRASSGDRIDVFDDAGAYAGTLPAGFPFPAAFLDDARFVAVHETADGAQRMVLHRLERRR
jgi:hypothetical protein